MWPEQRIQDSVNQGCVTSVLGDGLFMFTSNAWGFRTPESVSTTTGNGTCHITPGVDAELEAERSIDVQITCAPDVDYIRKFVQCLLRLWS